MVNLRVLFAIPIIQTLVSAQTCADFCEENRQLRVQIHPKELSPHFPPSALFPAKRTPKACYLAFTDPLFPASLLQTVFPAR
jgi:hypothetical protein